MIEQLRAEVENSIVCNGISHSTTMKLNKELDEAVNKKQKALYEKYKAKNILQKGGPFKDGDEFLPAWEYLSPKF